MINKKKTYWYGFVKLVGFTLSVLALLPSNPLWAQQTRSFSIATGGTGGVYYVMGGGIANMLTKYLPNAKVTAEATAAAVDNGKLIEARKADLAFMPGDVSYDAYMGQGKFKNKIPLRTLLSLYSDYIHFVALDGTGIHSVKDLRGKRVSIGAPGRGREVKNIKLTNEDRR